MSVRVWAHDKSISNRGCEWRGVYRLACGVWHLPVKYLYCMSGGWSGFLISFTYIIFFLFLSAHTLLLCVYRISAFIHLQLDVILSLCPLYLCMRVKGFVTLPIVRICISSTLSTLIVILHAGSFVVVHAHLTAEMLFKFLCTPQFWLIYERICAPLGWKANCKFFNLNELNDEQLLHYSIAV